MIGFGAKTIRIGTFCSIVIDFVLALCAYLLCSANTLRSCSIYSVR